MSGSPRTRWGWHSLSPEWARRIVSDAEISPGELVLDLGAGTGALTMPLLAAGARVLAVELHPGRARTLRRRFAGADLTVVESDLRTFRFPRRPFTVVANPPFALTGLLVDALLTRDSGIRTAHLVVQRQAARRLTGSGRHVSVDVGRLLPRSAFHPRPAVDCAVLVLRRHGPR